MSSLELAFTTPSKVNNFHGDLERLLMRLLEGSEIISSNYSCEMKNRSVVATARNICFPPSPTDTLLDLYKFPQVGSRLDMLGMGSLFLPCNFRLFNKKKEENCAFHKETPPPPQRFLGLTFFETLT